MMKNLFMLLLCCFLLATAARPAPAEEEGMSEADALKLAFPDADAVEKKTFIITSALKESILKTLRAGEAERLYTCHIARKNGRVAGYAVIDDVLGKHRPITYMVVLDPDCSVRAVEILAYREPYGWEIKRDNWRAQFTGKSLTDKLKLDDGIVNISGATISCRNVTDAVHNVLSYMTVLTPTLGPATPPAAPQKFTRSQVVMGTTLDLTVYAPSRDAADAAMNAAFAEVSRLDAALSTYKPESEISRLNRAAGGEAMTVGTDTMNLLSISQAISRRTGGAFDVTAGPLVSLWQAAAKSNAWPSAETVAAARALVGSDKMELLSDKRSARLPAAGMAVDFGAIGKGYALDRAAEILRGKGIGAALLNFGGNVLVLGLPPGDAHWLVPLRDPRNPNAVLTTLQISAGSVSTTADYERGLRVAGKAVSHVVDPRTGLPASGVVNATVAAGTATEADALSTACYVLGMEQGLAQAKREGLALLLIDEGGAQVQTDAFKALRKDLK